MRNRTSWSRLAIMLLGLGAVLAAGASLGGTNDDAGEGEAEMTSGRRPAFVKSTQRNPAVKASKPSPREVMYVLLLVDGILIGIVLSAILAIGLYAFDWLSFGGGLTAQAPEALYAPTPALAPICPPCDVSCGVTSTPTSTPDFAATATQACSEWRSLFPATPCPGFVAPSP